MWSIINLPESESWNAFFYYLAHFNVKMQASESTFFIYLNRNSSVHFLAHFIAKKWESESDVTLPADLPPITSTRK